MDDKTEWIRDHAEHSTIVTTIKNMIKQGKKTDEIVRVVGMPKEVIERYEREEQHKK